MVVIVVVGVNEGRCHEAIAVAEVFPEVVYQGVFGEGKPGYVNILVEFVKSVVGDTTYQIC